MNIKLQTVNPSYHVPAAVPDRRAVAPEEKVKGNYDTVTIRGTYSAAENDDGFSRMLARRAASQIGSGADPERVRELGQQVADGSYQPDARKIAGRLLGLGGI